MASAEEYSTDPSRQFRDLCTDRVLEGCEADGAAVEGQPPEGRPAPILVAAPLRLPFCRCDISPVLLYALSSHVALKSSKLARSSEV